MVVVVGISPLGARLALWGAREIVSLFLSSLVAGSATTLYAAYHFHRLAPYGALANLLAGTVVSVWVMPMGIAGALLVPLGFDAIFWQLMGYGLDWMIAVALWVTSLPGAVGRITAFGVGPLLLGTAGLVVLCLLKSPLRYGGAAFLAAGIFWAAATPQPDVLVAPKWRGRGGSRCKRPAGDVQIRQRQFCFPALARRRCRWALGQGQGARRRTFVR